MTVKQRSKSFYTGLRKSLAQVVNISMREAPALVKCSLFSGGPYHIAQEEGSSVCLQGLSNVEVSSNCQAIQ